jgi:crotonobetainyl-CoA:carnitine CoA-transferase CaiB-like acyl-CoA transferase
VRVLEFGHVVAGPSTGQLLADLGADVVKVEPPTGDALRQWPPFTGNDDEIFSFNFGSLNRNKRSVCLDLKEPADLDRARRLCGAADVLVENYRPGVLDRLGLGFCDLEVGYGGLIYCSVSGFGRMEPYSSLGAYDVVIQGMTGVMSVTGEPDGPPAKAGIPIGDFVAGLYAALTITSLLPKVRGSHTTVRVDVPMFDCLLAISGLQISEYWGTGRVPERLGSAHARNAPYQAFDAADGMFTVAAGNDRLWREVCIVTGLVDLFDDERFRSQQARAHNQAELAELLSPVFARQKIEFWLKEFHARGVPAGPVRTYAEALACDYVKDSRLLRDLPIPTGGSMPVVVFPARIDGLEPREDFRPPRHGENNDDVFDEWLGEL